MYQLAFVINDTLIYWHSVILALAVATGIVLFLAAYCRRTGEIAAAVVACPVCTASAIALSRLVYWFFRPELYKSISEALGSNGCALMGAFLGCFLAACLLRLLKTVDNLPALLDSLCIGGAAAIALGRLSFLFTPEDRGEILTGFTGLPFVHPVINATSGTEEYRFATFAFQAMATGCIFLYLLICFLRGLRKRQHRDGTITMKFLLLYCASQIVLDSTRYDGLHLRSNGFISAVQVACAVVLVLAIILLSVRFLRKAGGKLRLIPIWLLSTASLGGCAYMEYFVQRHGDRAAMAYGVMSICLLVIVFAGFLLLHWGQAVSREDTP